MCSTAAPSSTDPSAPVDTSALAGCKTARFSGRADEQSSRCPNRRYKTAIHVAAIVSATVAEWLLLDACGNMTFPFPTNWGTAAVYRLCCCNYSEIEPSPV